MEVKGSAVKTTREFVLDNYPDEYENFLKHLPQKSREIYDDLIFANKWYPLKEGLLIPTEVIGKLFFDNDYEKASYELGKDSAKRNLNGVYKIFIKIARLDNVLKRTQIIFSAHYSQGTLELIENKPNLKKFKVTGFSEDEKLIFPGIAGWIEEIFKVVGANIATITHKIEPAGDLVTGYIYVKLL